eukprot:782013-Amphidinium_carterae.1
MVHAGQCQQERVNSHPACTAEDTACTIQFCVTVVLLVRQFPVLKLARVVQQPSLCDCTLTCANTSVLTNLNRYITPSRSFIHLIQSDVLTYATHIAKC